MEKWKKRGLIGITAVVILGLIGFSLGKGLELETAPVKKSIVTSTVLEKGKVISSNNVNLYSETQGKVKEIYKNEGDRVAKGTILASIDVTELESQIAQLEGELKALQGSRETSLSQSGREQIRQQQLALEQAQVALELAEENFSRIQELHNEGGVTLAEYQQARAELDTKKKAVSQGEASLNAAKRQGQGSSLQFQGQEESLVARLKYLRLQKEKSEITSDREGTVLSRKVKKGDFVAPGTMLFEVGKTAGSEVEAFVGTKDSAALSKEDKVNIIYKLPGKDLEVVGTIKKIAPAAEEQLSSLGIMQDRIKVTVEPDKQPEGLRVVPGTTVDVVFTTQKTGQVTSVPREAVFTDKGQDYAWVVREGAAALVRVTTGVEGDEMVEVKEGLTAGDVIIMNPHHEELKEGSKIKKND